MEFVRRLHAQDLAVGYAGTFLPRQLEKKYKSHPPCTRASREPRRSLPVVPLAAGQRYYGEAPDGLRRAWL
jgi:hypothetical protein